MNALSQEVTSPVRIKRIAALNDALRHTFSGGKVMMSAGIAALTDRTKATVFTAVRNFSDFSDTNDPHGEHDFGAFCVEGMKCFFKVDYYDKALEYGSEDPADPTKTTRVLTVMLANEY